VLNFQESQLMHLHGEQRYPMSERGPIDAADQDPERGWVKGGRVFRCTQCDEEIVVAPIDDRRPDAEPA